MWPKLALIAASMPSYSIFVSIQLYPAVFVQAGSEEFFAQPYMFHKRATLPSGCQYGYCIADPGDSQALFILKLFWRLPEQPPAVKAHAVLQPWPRRRDLFPASTAAFIAVRSALSLKLCAATAKFLAAMTAATTMPLGGCAVDRGTVCVSSLANGYCKSKPLLEKLHDSVYSWL